MQIRNIFFLSSITSKFSQILSRDNEEVDKLKEEVERIGLEQRQFEDREHFLLQSCHNAEQTTVLLSQLEIQGRTRLEQEMAETFKTEKELSDKLKESRQKVQRFQDGFRKMKEFQNIEQLQMEVDRKQDEPAKDNTLGS